MGETVAMARVIICLGMIAAIALLMFPDTAPPIPVATFPVLNSPFAAKTWTFAFVSNGSAAPLNVRGVNATQVGYCQASEFPVTTAWYGCLNSADQNATYVTTGLGGFSTNESQIIGGFPDSSDQWLVVSIQMSFQCKSHGDGITFDFIRSNVVFLSIGDKPGATSCTVTTSGSATDFNLAPGYTNNSFFTDVSMANITPLVGSRAISGAELSARPSIGLPSTDDLITISYIGITITYQRTFRCVFNAGGNPWDTVANATYYVGCVLSAFVSFTWDMVLLIFNIASFILQFLFIIVTLMIDIFIILVWLYSIPGMPLVVQGIIDVIISGCIVVMSISIIRVLRGSGSS